MKLALSNLAIPDNCEEKAYALLQELGFIGLEIAPTKLLGDAPYNDLQKAQAKAQMLLDNFGLAIPSMQSIWYGQSGNIFVKTEAEALYTYTKKAIDFAAAVKCKSLVFGCPKSRNIPSDKTQDDALPFFEKIAEYAHKNGTAIALEANVKEYGTNFINTSADAFSFAKKVKNLKVNYDLGTLIANGEDLQPLHDNLSLVSHIHISEPQLAPIKERAIHKKLAQLLKNAEYTGFVSVEMKAAEFDELSEILKYIAEVFA